MTNDSKISMHRLNPTHKVEDEVFMGLFPPKEDYYNELLQNECFKLFLMSDGTTKDGQDRIADYYQVGESWEQMDKKKCSHERYFQLLVLVKTKSPVNFLWVSFVEGLHKHAAIILALLCTKFDYKYKIQPGSLTIQDFKATMIPHFVDPKISPEEQIKFIMNGQESLTMLKNTFTVEVYIPKKVDGNILELMDSMCKQSE
jgi:hypothetical protein